MYHKSVNEEQNNLQFQTNLQSWSDVWDHQFEYVFTDQTQKPSFSWTSQIFGFVKMPLFIRKYVLVILEMGHVNFRKMEIDTWKDGHPINSSSSHLNYQGQCLGGQKYP